jgi:hypothetical protein
MSLRYYPSFRVLKNQSTKGDEFILGSTPYTGKYYITYDGRAYTGSDPVTGPSQLLTPIKEYNEAPGINSIAVPQSVKNRVEASTGVSSSPSSPSISKVTGKPMSSKKVKGIPTSYYPYPLESDYSKGYILRYFIKKVNNAGYVTEISPEEYSDILNGNVDYDLSFYQYIELMWKLTGPLNSVRISQYDLRAGIIDTNKRLVETANRDFLGITEFIGEEYDKYARPSS